MVRTGRRRALMVVVAAMLAMAAPMVVAATARADVLAQYSPGVRVWFDRVSVPQGGVLKINSAGWAPGASVQMTVFSDPVDLGVALADSIGSMSHSWNVPTDFPLGAHTVTLTGLDLAGSIVTVSGTFDVTPLAGAIAGLTVPGPQSELPVTGARTEELLLLAGVLVAGGASLSVWARRRAASA